MPVACYDSIPFLSRRPIDETLLDAPVRKRIGEILIERGKLDQANLDRALRLQQETAARGSARCS